MVSFIEPRYLWLLLLLPPLIWLGLLGQRSMRRWRTGISIALRITVMLCLIGALAGTQLVRPVRNLTTIFLLDVSDSVSPAQRARYEQFIAAALTTMPDDDRAAIVVFGENALIERLPTAERTLGRLQTVPVAARTNIEQGLTLALALFPADTQKRIVLLSDGGENTGRAISALNLANDRNVVIDVVNAENLSGAEVAITSLQVPSQARLGQELALISTISSSTEQAATLRWEVDQQVLSEQPIQLPAGSTSFTSTLVLDSPGFHRITAHVVPTDDTRLQNNQAVALINITGQPRVLVIANEQEDATNIMGALSAADLNPTLLLANQSIPTSLAEFAEYESVLLVNVPRIQLPDSTQQVLQTYVHDLGKGLVMIGGDSSFGVGGYLDSPLEEALPVDMELRNREKFPPVSVVVVYDISGSMSEVIGGKPKVQIAAEGAARVAQLLRDYDEITVIPFDSAPQNTYGPVSGADRNEAAREIIARGQSGGGGIAVHDSLVAANNAIRERDFPIRHVIVLADGSDSQQQEGSAQLAERMSKDGITVSTIAIGNGGDVPFLRTVAKAGKGRFFLVENALDLPDVLLQEAQLALAPYIIEQPYQPLLGSDSPILAALLNRPWPTLYGLDGTMPKDSATVVLWGPEDAPLLAQWQYGLGRTVAWTSDFKGQWGKDLVSWSEFPRLLAQMVGWTLPVVNEDLISVDTTFIGPDLQINVFANDTQSQPLSGLTVQTTIVGSEGIVNQVTLSEVSAGVYQARTSSPPTGTYFLQIMGTNAEGQQAFQRTTGVIVPYSPEYRQGQSNPTLLQAIAQSTSGRTITEPAAAFDHTLQAVRQSTPIGFLLLLLALLLFLVDVAFRRLRLKNVRELLPQRQRQPQPATAPTMGRLSAARQRARRTMDQPDAPIEPLNAPPDAPVYRAAPPPPAPKTAPPQPAAPPPQPAPAAPPPATAPVPTLGPKPKDVDIEEITDPLERLRAAKNRARRR